MKYLKRDSLPRWYGLSWNAAEWQVLARLHRELVPQLEPISSEGLNW